MGWNLLTPGVLRNTSDKPIASKSQGHIWFEVCIIIEKKKAERKTNRQAGGKRKGKEGVGVGRRKGGKGERGTLWSNYYISKTSCK